MSILDLAADVVGLGQTATELREVVVADLRQIAEIPHLSQEQQDIPDALVEYVLPAPHKPLKEPASSAGLFAARAGLYRIECRQATVGQTLTNIDTSEKQSRPDQSQPQC